MIFETHAHYDDEAFDEDRDMLLSVMQENGIEYIVNVGANLKSTAASIALAQKYPFIYAAAGVHPSDTEDLDEESFLWLKEQCLLEKVVAVGEIGLDYYWDNVERSVQKFWFERQLDLAREMKKPVIIHSRDAAKDTFDIMAAKNAGEIGGVVHCYSYSPEMALDYVKMGFYIGIGGVVTFQNGKKMKEVVEAVPMECLLLETDSPYLSPVPNRGKRNTSLNLPYVAQKIAEIKGISYDEVIAITADNAKKMYKI
ncbi:MAG: TatD family hydrolase [Lachnospiraceae bacterium]|nr:TatD family hydrolase [Lachnospiraceae bacterium]